MPFVTPSVLNLKQDLIENCHARSGSTPLMLRELPLPFYIVYNISDNFLFLKPLWPYLVR